MKSNAKIFLFKDQPDYIKKITDDNIFNITGEKGSGKSFFGLIKDKDDKCIVIHLDPLFSPDTCAEHEFSNKMREILIKKYGENLNPDKYFEEKYYPIIIDYLKQKNKTGYIEGGSIAEMQNVSNIVGTVIVKKTGILKCFFRTVKRDYKNQFFMKKEIESHGKFAKITRLYKVIKRRKKIFKSYHDIESFIKRIESI